MAPPVPTDERAAAIVVGLDCITGLQTARILAKRGIRVIAIAKNTDHFCASTRVCSRIVGADTAGPELIDTLDRLAGRYGPPPVLYPCTDNAVLQLSEHRDRIADYYRLALPAHDKVEMLMSKPRLARYLEDNGFRSPKTRDVHRRADLDRAIADLSFPCVLKPAIKDARWISNTTTKAFKVRNADDLVATFERCADWTDHFIVQEWIEGGESDLYSCNCYFGVDGKPLASFVARKIRQWPPETGTSALGVECRADEVRDESLRLFESVDYRGLGYVEMKRDARSGEYFIIEPNLGRPTGRSAIAEAGGVEILQTMYCDLTGLPLPDERTQRTQHYLDAKWIYLRHDLQAALYWWRRGELSVGDWLCSMRGRKAYAVFSASDPRPFMRDVAKSVRTGIEALAERRHRRATAPSPAIVSTTDLAGGAAGKRRDSVREGDAKARGG